MSLHRITAGSGYDYLTRQVAAMDSTERGHIGLASYYTEKGEAPGQWVGSGLFGIEGIDSGDIVTAEQMLSLFGSGHHPLAAQRAAAIQGRPGVTQTQMREAVRLGQPFRVYAGDISPFRIEVSRRLQQLNTERGRPRDAAVGIQDRARIRTEIGLEFFRQDFGRAPLNSRELAGHIARLSRQQTTAIAGFDLTFSPVKSVSALWAVAEPGLAAAIERAHQAAVSEALVFIEQHALYTRTGTNGVRQVDVRGLIGTAFTHRDSRAGDPDLHTHVAIANKVQTAIDGRWLSIDGRVLYKAITAASETYNISLETHLARLGIRFAARPDADPEKRPVREIVGVEPALNKRWSQRRQRITDRQAELAAAFLRDHARPPTPVEAIALAQQATLETREAKHEPRSLAEQRASWHTQATTVLGGEHQLRRMIHAALHPGHVAMPTSDREWFDQATRAVLARVEQDRSVWQSWHIRAEALRYTRAAGVPGDAVPKVVEWLINDIITGHSIPLSHDDSITEPAPLRRSDGASVYSVAGARLYTSRRILDAESRLVTAAGQQGGRSVAATAIDLALLETHANGVDLNPGQILLVREMATSGFRLQLAIAPAGSGKTTAMQALARAWTIDGGYVIGLAPSAVAAAGLREQIGGRAETLAKVAWHITHGSAPAWMNRIGDKTLVIIDEAGMADTITLDTVVQHILGRGGSVRLIGDDQQLAAVGAGGVLRDIQNQHGALRLAELVRFTDSAEGLASLALREGHTEALGFYLDRDRVHIGTAATMADDLFQAWSHDRAAGQDSIMLAPTRELVADLNQRARTHRLGGAIPIRCVDLADGNQASVGDTIITRRNNRDLRTGPTDWVKNGDRWTITAITSAGINVHHTQHRRSVTLPSDYVADWTELGYACTTHTAQGVTADTCHGLLAGDESRQQAYTMLTRGRHANTTYLVVVGDGDPHTAIRPETLNPQTATDTLHRILASDESPTSASTTLSQAADPAALLGEATTRYRDAIVFAADHIATAVAKERLEDAIGARLPGITQAEAWPALRAQLLILDADNQDPIDAFTRAASTPVVAGRNPAAILAWRLDDAHPGGASGPLPWLPGVPAKLARHPAWGPYLQARAQLVADRAEKVHQEASHRPTPSWVPSGGPAIPASLLADLAVWRAANTVPDEDPRPTGEPELRARAQRWQHRLESRIQATQSAALDEWGRLLHDVDPAIGRDPYNTALAEQLAQLSRADLPARQLLLDAAQRGPLPDDHAAAALWWRIASHLSPAVSTRAGPEQHLITNWQAELEQRVGVETNRELQESRWWPALVATIERGIQRGWNLDRLLDSTRPRTYGMVDTCQAMTWQLSLLTDRMPPSDDGMDEADDDRPEDLGHGWTPNEYTADAALPAVRPSQPAEPESVEFDDLFDEDPDEAAERALAIEALVRKHLPLPEPSAAQIRHLQDRADAWRASCCSPERLAHINELAAQFYEQRFPDSWAQPYLRSRFHTDLAGDPSIRPGYAPEGWTALTDHLRRRGVTDDELLTAGLAKTASTGRLVDRFRDRVVFPINHQGAVIGFVGRRNPVHSDSHNLGPKYLNTPQTPSFVKGDQLYTTGPLRPGVIPVLVEGPMDAIAVDLAGGGAYAGVASLGTSLTENQANQLREIGLNPVIATDADSAGAEAARRAYWILAAHSIQPSVAGLPAGNDPAELLASHAANRLRTALEEASPLGEHLLERLAISSDGASILDALNLVASQPSARWDSGAALVAERSGMPVQLVKTALAPLVEAWNTDPRLAAGRSAGRATDLSREIPSATTPIHPEIEDRRSSRQHDQRLGPRY